MYSLSDLGKGPSAAYVSLLRSSRLLVVRDPHRDSERNNFQLVKMPVLLHRSSAGARLFWAASVPFCSFSPHLHIRGHLNFFTFLAFEGFEGLSIPVLLVSMQVRKEMERTAAAFHQSGL